MPAETIVPRQDLPDATWCAAGLAMVIAYAAWVLGVRAGSWAPSLRATYVTVNGTMVALYVVASVLQWRAGQSPHLDPATRSAWRVMFATNLGAFALSGTGTIRALLGITSAGGPFWQAAQPIIYVSTNALLHCADAAMYAAKEAGGDRHAYAT